MAIQNEFGLDNKNNHFVHYKYTKEPWSLLVYGKDKQYF